MVVGNWPLPMQREFRPGHGVVRRVVRRPFYMSVSASSHARLFCFLDLDTRLSIALLLTFV
jgi:hypothetical protein